VSKDVWAFSSHDLHAWPEMYFGGVGWVRFEPTPQSRASVVPAYTTQAVPQAGPTQTSSAPAAAPTLNRIDRSADPTTGTRQATHHSFFASPTFFVLVGVLAAMLLVLLAPRVLRARVRRRRWEEATDTGSLVEAAWAEIRDTALDLRLTWDDRVTPRSAAGDALRSFGDPRGDTDGTGRSSRRGEQADPEATAALHRLLLLLERARYARTLPADATTRDQVQHDTRLCVEALRAGVGQRRRARATWTPASLPGSLVPGRSRRSSARGRGLTPQAGVDRAV
jgi:hypothetical protein